MATNDTLEHGESRADASEGGQPPRLRLPLTTIDDVRREMGRIYREGRSGRRDVGEVSKLANVLSLLGRLIEGAEIEARIAKLEAMQR